MLIFPLQKRKKLFMGQNQQKSTAIFGCAFFVYG
jgi:hypothetical protein